MAARLESVSPTVSGRALLCRASEGTYRSKETRVPRMSRDATGVRAPA
jgi:hypothetical protein